jgi:hypothetical protein
MGNKLSSGWRMVKKLSSGWMMGNKLAPIWRGKQALLWLKGKHARL